MKEGITLRLERYSELCARGTIRPAVHEGKPGLWISKFDDWTGDPEKPVFLPLSIEELRAIEKDNRASEARHRKTADSVAAIITDLYKVMQSPEKQQKRGTKKP